ncbi:MAG: lytic transglycosylase domain-containing protein, partial [Rhodospirillales bacterium]|nr:lytic transglycosylase domain-containing protein [Rhodospirillales bacterium]
RRILPALVALAVAATSPVFAADKTKDRPTSEGELMTAAINAGAGRLGRKAPLPKVLSDKDVNFYKAAFAAQERQQWAQADRELANAGNAVLKGHVLAQRYLMPGYHASFKELQAWMAEYADLPQAETIHRLAKARSPKGGGTLKTPQRGFLSGTLSATSEEEVGANWDDVLRNRSGSSSGPLKSRFRQLLRDSNVAGAEALLQRTESQRAADRQDIDELRTALAAAHYQDGRDEQAFRLASEAAESSGESVPAAHWHAGLSAWRLGKFDAARRHFEVLGNATGNSGWMVAAGAYWAARANLKAKRPEVINHWLEVASAYPRTFYGMLARRALGQSVSFAWETPPFTDLDSDVVSHVAAGKRALALLQVNDRGRAEEELRKLYPEATPGLAKSMLALAHAGGMPELAVRLSTVIADRDGRYHDTAAFPMPDWRPDGGWQVDKALVYAIVRQESAFDPKCRSSAGASGLMQIMPATARYVSGGKAGKLFDPEYNLGLGQRYITHLLDQDSIKGNLLMMIAAYNSGPGPVPRWAGQKGVGKDPLLFIESIPLRETRVFVQKVLTNLWIYRHRMGLTSPSLDAVVANKWPTYDMDKATPQLAAVFK